MLAALFAALHFFLAKKCMQNIFLRNDSASPLTIRDCTDFSLININQDAITSEVFFNEVDEQALPALAAASESLFDLFTEIKRS